MMFQRHGTAKPATASFGKFQCLASVIRRRSFMAIVCLSRHAILKHISVISNVAEGQDAVAISTTESSVSVFYEDRLLVMASVKDPETISATLDLRPLGLQLFSSASELVVGNSRLVTNKFVRGRAINLGE